MSSGPPSKGEVFKEWIDSKEEIKNGIQFLTLQNSHFRSFNSSRFNTKRNGVHVRQIDEILQQINKYEQISEEYSKQLDSMFLDNKTNNLMICFSNNSQNIKVRIVKYLIQLKQEIENEICTAKYVQIQNKISDLRSLLSFLSGGFVPENQIMKVLPSFYELKPIENNDILQKRITILDYKIQLMQNEIKSFTIPLWVTNFKSYFLNVIKEVQPHIDKELSYFRPHEIEVELSRAVFSTDNKYRHFFDSIVDEIATISKSRFIQDLITLSYELMPKDELSSSMLQSIALLLFYRLGMNRAYELYSHLFTPQPEQLAKKLEILGNMPAKNFPLPIKLMQHIDTEKPIREIFQNDKNFMSAAMFLTNAEFESNPIDSLYDIHKCLICIHKAALINRLGDTLASFDDVNEMLCFDDLFSLLFGVCLASDLPSITRLVNFIDDFAPKQCLSPSFEYALSNLEALLMHFEKTDI